jgi:hypothetical protein
MGLVWLRSGAGGLEIPMAPWAYGVGFGMQRQLFR